jgi:hypothetical protein
MSVHSPAITVCPLQLALHDLLGLPRRVPILCCREKLRKQQIQSNLPTLAQ